MNKSVAAQYFHRAAEKGHIDAQYWIGYMYYTGEGLPKNRERAIEWLTKAAEKGDGPAREWLRAHAAVDTTLPGVPHKRDIDRCSSCVGSSGSAVGPDKWRAQEHHTNM
jgi:TPR repeat protein